ncbi:MAG: discoidin domain-containing protein [Turicibacter sanguinis]
MEVVYMNAIVSKFTSLADERLEAYDELYKIPSEKITSITTNGGQYASNDITKAIDGNFNTNWHSGKQNTSTHTNEVIVTLDELTTVNRIMYTNNRSRGFAQEFEIYISKTSQGETFEKVTSDKCQLIRIIRWKYYLIQQKHVELNLCLLRDMKIGQLPLSLEFINKIAYQK